MISLADELGLTTVAEGIENAETVAWLRDHGCRIGQGFYLSPPVDAATLLALMAGTSPSGSGTLDS